MVVIKQEFKANLSDHNLPLIHISNDIFVPIVTQPHYTAAHYYDCINYLTDLHLNIDIGVELAITMEFLTNTQKLATHYYHYY